MDRQFVFWGLMLLAVILLLAVISSFGGFSSDPVLKSRLTFGGNIVLFILLGLLGWTVFGDPIK